MRSRLSYLPKLAADIKLNLARLAILYKTQTTLARSRWFSRGSKLKSLRRWSVLPLEAAVSHSWAFPVSNGSGRLRRKSLRRAARRSAGVLEISSQMTAPWVSTFSRSSRKARAEAHLRKIPWVWGPLWKRALRHARIAGGRALFVQRRERGTPNNLPVVFRNNFKGVLRNQKLKNTLNLTCRTYFLGEGLIFGFNSKTISLGIRLLLQCVKSKPSSAHNDCLSLANWIEWGRSHPTRGQGALSLSLAYRVYAHSPIRDSSSANRATSPEFISGPTPSVFEHSVPLRGSL